MNKIKDIIYNKSDILIAILILAIAALIIFWRLSIILEYPKEIIGTDSESEVFTEPTETGDEGASDDAQDSGESTDQQAGESTDSQEGTDSQAESTDQQAGESTEQQSEEGTDAQTEDAVDESKAQWDGDKLAADLDVLITGTTATATVQCLIDAGVFENYAEYQKLCEEMGYDHNKMRAGDFLFDKGSTKKDIIKIINYSKM